MSKEAMKLALEALKGYRREMNDGQPCDAEKALEKALSNHCEDNLDMVKQKQGEPVAWMYPDDLKRFETSEAYAQAYSIEMVSPTQGETVPLYTTPQQRTWVGLDHHDKKTFSSWLDHKSDDEVFQAIEAKLKELNI